MASICVAMSGGVDSSVAAALLVEAGHEVTGVTMLLTPRAAEDGGADTNVALAAAVCDLLGILHGYVDLSEHFAHAVTEPFAKAYARGRTPNPCVGCNDEVKFGVLLEHARGAGAESLATGHYARIVSVGGRPFLAASVDPSRDQTYFLYRVGGGRLSRLVFPLGDLTKEAVREMARERRLPVSEREDSQEICFTHGEDYATLVARIHPEALEPGPIVLEDGTELGEHKGIARYTIGQRKGLGVAADEPLYVVGIDADLRLIVVGPRERLECRRIVAKGVVWHARESQGLCSFRFRHGRSLTQGKFEVSGGTLTVEAETPVEGVASGQALVCYEEGVVLGGGVIEGAS